MSYRPNQSSTSVMTAAEGFVEVKSKFDAEFRRFSVDRAKYRTFEDFHHLLDELHIRSGGGTTRGANAADTSTAADTAFQISYIDPKDNDLLPINNTDNYLKALHNAKPLLRLVIQRQGECEDSFYGAGGHHSRVKSSLLTSMLGGSTPRAGPGHGGGRGAGPGLISISQPSEFRQVSAIIDVDIVPETCRRVRLLKHGSDKPLGFYIRDGTSVRVTPAGLEKVPGIFISRLVPGGLAESTGLLAVNDEVLEVNGIEVAGKSLDQVTDMMVANSSNLIVTVKPSNQRTLMPRRGSFSRNSNMSHGSVLSNKSSTQSTASDDRDDEDEIRDLTGAPSSSSSLTAASATANNNMMMDRAGHGSSSQRKQVLHL